MLKQKDTGQIIVISAPSGSGKGTIIKKLLEKNNKDRILSISATSRKPRKDEENGKDYFFLTKDEFKEKIKENYFLEYAMYAGNYYGTPKNFIKENINKGKDVILEIEIQGAKEIKQIIPEAIFIFIMPPSLKTLLQRLKKRGTESNDKILQRFNTAYKEINEVTKYNYVVVNDEIEKAVDKVDAILKAEKCRVDRIEEVYLDNEEEKIHELLMEDEKFDNNGIKI